MNITSLSSEIFDALQEFDRSCAPLGLYAAGDLAGEEPHKPRQEGRPLERWVRWNTDHFYPEWNGALKPFFEARGCDLGSNFDGSHTFGVPGSGRIEFVLKRVSKIKVREYGSRYHVDKGENFSERWNTLDMDKAIAALWSGQPTKNTLRLLLFLGFDKAQRPFERELGELKPHQTRALHDIEFFERTWDDSVGRGFKVKAALWAQRLK